MTIPFGCSILIWFGIFGSGNGVFFFFFFWRGGTDTWKNKSIRGGALAHVSLFNFKPNLCTTPLTKAAVVNRAQSAIDGLVLWGRVRMSD